VILAIIAGATLGLASCLHCVGMCGPLMSIYIDNDDRGSFVGRRLLLHHTGRIFTYLAMGLFIGAAGDALNIISLGSSVAVMSGAILAFAGVLQLYGSALHLPTPVADIMRKLGRIVATSTNITSRPIRMFAMGVVNGLLPCGVTLTAIMASATIPDVDQRLAFLLSFGVATLPALVGMGMLLSNLGRVWRKRLDSSLAVATVLVGLIVIFRGLSLDVPYLSPRLVVENGVHQHNGCCGK